MPIKPDAPRRRGRPALPEDDRKRHTMTFRVRSNLRDKLKALADTNGRSISEEIELILELNLIAGRVRIPDQESEAAIFREPGAHNNLVSLEDNNALVQAAVKAKMIFGYAKFSCRDGEAISEIDRVQKSLSDCVENACNRIARSTV